MPDFDVDFCYERRQEVIDYVNRKYGRDHVAQIVTFGTMAARAAVREACPARDKPTVQCSSPRCIRCFFLTFPLLGKVIFCLRGYCRAIARSAVQKQPERRALRPQARFGAQPPQAALGAEIGCSSVTPPPNRRRMGGGSNLALPPISYRHAAQSWHLT